MAREGSEERAVRLLAELHEATREAAGVLKDLTALTSKARVMVEEYARTEVEEFIRAAVKLVNDKAYEEGQRIQVILQEQIDAGCKRAETHIRHDYELAAVIRLVAEETIGILKADGYDFTQPHE